MPSPLTPHNHLSSEWDWNLFPWSLPVAILEVRVGVIGNWRSPEVGAMSPVVIPVCCDSPQQRPQPSPRRPSVQAIRSKERHLGKAGPSVASYPASPPAFLLSPRLVF